MGLIFQIAAGIILAPLLVIAVAFCCAIGLACYDKAREAVAFTRFILRDLFVTDHGLRPPK